MKQLTGLTAAPNQTFSHPLPDGETVFFSLRYAPSSQMFFLSLEVGEFEAKNIRLCNNANILRQYKNILNFGLFVEVSDGYEPFLINDFVSGRCTLNVLTAEEVEQLEDFLA